MSDKLKKNIDDYYKCIKENIYNHDLHQKLNINYHVNKNNENMIDILNKDKTIIFSGRYFCMGIYNNSTNMWHWAYNLDHIDKSTIIHLNKSKDMIINDKYFNKNDFKVSGKKINELIKYILYVTKSQWYLSLNHFEETKNYTQYIGIYGIDKNSLKSK